MTIATKELDVRPILRAGGEPFAAIMDAVNSLQPMQSLRLLATFEPIPLFRVLAKKGFTHNARELSDGDWEVVFIPLPAEESLEQSSPPAQPDNKLADNQPTAPWPAPARSMDNRDLEPPEPMVRVLAAIEEMRSGEVLSALLCREPVFLLPELKSRGYAYKGAFEPDGVTYKLLVRVGNTEEAAK